MLVRVTRLSAVCFDQRRQPFEFCRLYQIYRLILRRLPVHLSPLIHSLQDVLASAKGLFNKMLHQVQKAGTLLCLPLLSELPLKNHL